MYNLFRQYSSEPNKGVIQHEYWVTHSFIREQYPMEAYLTAHRNHSSETKLICTAHTSSDVRVLGELPVLNEYERAFYFWISQIRLTGDTFSGMHFKQKQLHPDVIVTIDTISGTKEVYQDVKSGMNMIKHSSRGSIGLITFDLEQKVIPFTTKDMDLLDINKERLKNLYSTLKEDNLQDIPRLKTALDDASTILHTEKDVVNANSHIQNLLWREMQCHPDYKRSVAFTFTQHQTSTPYCSKYETYKRKFVSLLDDRTYDLNKISDRKEIFKAMILSYRDVDPEMKKKLLYLVKHCNISMDTNLLQLFASLIKETIIT